MSYMTRLLSANIQLRILLRINTRCPMRWIWPPLAPVSNTPTRKYRLPNCQCCRRLEEVITSGNSIGRDPSQSLLAQSSCMCDCTDLRLGPPPSPSALDWDQFLRAYLSGKRLWKCGLSTDAKHVQGQFWLKTHLSLVWKVVEDVSPSSGADKSHRSAIT